MEETNSTNEDQPVDTFELKLQRSADGQKANSRGKLVAALVGRASGAVRAEGYDNNIWAIDDARVRFTSVTGGKQTFSFNPAGPASLIVASSEDVPTPDKPLLNRLYGLRLVDCVRAGRRAYCTKAYQRLVGTHHWQGTPGHRLPPSQVHGSRVGWRPHGSHGCHRRVDLR